MAAKAHPEVSVVMPTRDRRTILEQTLMCVLSQRDVDLEVVVVDDGSTDGTWDFLEHHPDPRVRGIRNERSLGHAGARNRALDAARGRWIAFCDDDDLWSPVKLREQLRAAAEDPEAGWVMVGAVDVDPDYRVVGWKRCPTPAEGRQLLAANTVPGGGSGVLAKRDLVLATGGFDPDLRVGADRDMWIRLWLQSPFTTVDQPLVAHLVHPASVTQSSPGRREAFERLEDKYATERAAFGVDLDASALVRYGDGLVLGGDPVAGARLYVHAARRYGRPGIWPKAVLALVAPGVLRRRWRAYAEQRSRSLPADWRSEVDTWLVAWERAA